jgi:hypothetical protein
MTLELDGTIDREMVNRLRGLPHIDSVVYLRANPNEGN